MHDWFSNIIYINQCIIDLNSSMFTTFKQDFCFTLNVMDKKINIKRTYL